MFKNTADQSINFQGILKASGDDSGDVSGTAAIEVNIDKAGFQAGAGAFKYLTTGGFEYIPTQAETNGGHVAFRLRETTIITQMINVYPIDVALYKADVSNLPTTSQVPTFGTQFKRESQTGNVIYETQTDEQAP